MNGFKRFFAMLATFASIAGVLQFVATPAAQAADANQFDPGYIIADSVFFDGNSMGSAEIQSFLNGKVSACRAGYTCLKDYTQYTPTMPASSSCPGTYQGGFHSAADIIYGVGVVCGISQRVLLVLLQKEQGLVTDTWPSTSQYNKATGFSCPDTAPCDPAYAGFFYQVYSAASQFKTYGQNPSRWRYKAGQWNDIQYNPNPDCGTQRVFIANQATANLYIYTPYVPNQAAMDNLYGVGDYCSAYGNRNFWRLFTDWFGNPKSYSTDSRFNAFWTARGGPTGYMGPPVSYAVSLDANGGGWYQKFVYGTAYQTTAGVTSFVSNASNYLPLYNAYGGPAGTLGWPKGEWSCAPAGGCAQVFDAGAINSTAMYGTRVVWGGFFTDWTTAGGLNGTFGAALNDVRYTETGTNPKSIGWIQHFQGAVDVIVPGGNYPISNPGIVQGWYGNGAEKGWIGWPTGAQGCVSGACAMSFQNAIITSAAGKTGYATYGSLVWSWAVSGGLTPSGLGAATAPVAWAINGGQQGWAQTYERGSQAISALGLYKMTGAISQTWWSMGGTTGWLGWPTANEVVNTDGSSSQAFQFGVLFKKTDGTVVPIQGGLGLYWVANGGWRVIGAPTDAIQYNEANGGGWKQSFNNGIITQGKLTRPAFVPNGPILSTWSYYGGEWTWLGWPAGDQSCTSAANCTQAFQNGTATVTNGAVSFTK